MTNSILRLTQRTLLKFGFAITRHNNNLGRENYIPLTDKMDFTRMANLDLLAHEIKRNNIDGEIAELGVYRGDFAKYLNQLFPNRPLHLFDTFTGFDEKDVAVEKKNNFSPGSQDFSNTSIDLVLKKMSNPESCIIHKGFFPGTTKNLDPNLKFAFISIDADLYEPILEGLKYFYPRLSPGGYIMVHDFNFKYYSGANKAVTEFCTENRVAYTPISDGWGTAIISK